MIPLTININQTILVIQASTFEIIKTVLGLLYLNNAYILVTFFILETGKHVF